jgi:hypothetical protein
MVFKAIRLSCRILRAVKREQVLVPVVVSQVHDNGDEHGEGFIFVGLQDVEEVVILEEAHGSVGHLQVDSSNASHDPLEQLRDQVLNLVDFANLQDFLQLRQEKGLLNAVGEGPVLEQTFEESYGKGSVLRQEKHGASKQLLVELGAGLDLVQGDNHIFEEDNVLVSQRHGKPTNDAREDVEELGGSVELVSFMDERVEALIDRLSDHLPSGH